jgi:lipid II:glycine glycyltransferase (peptidoglycan interpeptide bridge formation enzyme)
VPFHWAGYRTEVQYTYRLEGLRSEDKLWAGLRGNIRGDIGKARKRLVVRDDLGIDAFYAVWAKTFARQGLPPPVSLSDLERIDAACAARNARAMLFASDEAERVHAVAYAVWDDKAAYYLLGGGDPDLRNSGATSLLVWELIMRAREVTDVFDFEGSMWSRSSASSVPSAAARRRICTCSGPPRRGRAALALRSGWRRLASTSTP